MLPLQQMDAHTRKNASSVRFAFKTGLAFRPFFWLGSVFLLLSFVLWSAFWQGMAWVSPYGGMIWWHQHEMLFGFTAAIVTGFLMTAVQSWTGLPSVKGGALWLLVALWALARVLLLFPAQIPPTLVLALDVAFLPLVALLMGRMVVQAKRWRNLVFIPILLLFTVANAGSHWGAMTHDTALIQQSSYLAIWVVLSLIIILGGRVIPFFTARALGVEITAPARWREQLVVASALGVCLVFLLGLFGVVVPKGVLALLLAVMVVFNMWRWMSWKLNLSWHQPLLWGLHLSYLFVMLGALLWLLSLWGLIPVDYALHLLTINGILGMILAMIARVSLGHTGRPIKALPGLSAALIAVFLAGLIRGLMLWVWPSAALGAYHSSLLLVILAYAWFVALYTVPLWATRADGRPG